MAEFCGAKDQCSDRNAVCRNGACECQAGFLDNSHTCGQYFVMMVRTVCQWSVLDNCCSLRDFWGEYLITKVITLYQ